MDEPSADRPPSAPPSLDIVAIGEPMLELNQARAGAGDAGGYLQGFGGDSSNMIIAAARSGARCAYHTRLGDDAFGRLFAGLWRDEGVDAGSVIVDPQAHTAVYFVTHGSAGHRFSYLRRGSAASRLTPAELPSALLREAAFTYASGISQAISESACDAVFEAFAQARRAGRRTAFDSNLRLALWPLARARALIGAAAGMADVFLPSLDDAVALSGRDDPEAIVDWAHRLGAPLVVLKLGAAGALASDGTRRIRVAGHRVASVDATGAGDCFCGSFLARLAAGDALEAALRYANAAAALSTTGYGAVAPLPRPDAVARLLADQNVPG